MRLQPARSSEEIDAYRNALVGADVAVIGAGRSGMACVRRLAEVGADVLLADRTSRAELPVGAEAERLGARLVDRFERWEQIDGVGVVIASPGVPADHPALAAARAAGVEVIGTLEFAYRLCASPVVAVTGTNGKGTTCRLLSGMLAEADIEHILAGNIGEPLADRLPAARAEVPAVVEVSSFQLETIAQFRPRVATILNIAPDHLDRHPDFEHYLEAKARIVQNQRAEDTVIINLDDEQASAIASRSAARHLTVSVEDTSAEAHVADGIITLRLDGETERICPASHFPLPGRHHLTNILVAAIGARLIGARSEAIARAIAGYTPPEHHMQVVDDVGGVTFINDSKASNPGAAVADIMSLDRPAVVIVGGKDKSADFSELGRVLSQVAGAVILIGEAAGRIENAMGRAPAERARSLEEAVTLASSLARPGDVVILAPACSSFDMFDDYAQRGRVFASCVEALKVE